ncbi:hypothetical protein [Phormidium sp. CCY1219]|uniref:hypothetical protein n=1 Tax=Phormidium sp. CCY1219 TaxID=2886104 RepID=UPI002D1EFC8C|nr:hypothetical protein [Phormidium sp. CCY1219]MEB3827117.1 hypothetical protein [Phormidium sp. CCY1219]
MRGEVARGEWEDLRPIVQIQQTDIASKAQTGQRDEKRVAIANRFCDRIRQIP